MRPRRLCRACREGLCAECSNWGAVAPACEHLCGDAPRQLSLLVGDDERPAACRSEAKAGGLPTTDEEVPW